MLSLICHFHLGLGVISETSDKPMLDLRASPDSPEKLFPCLLESKYPCTME